MKPHRKRDIFSRWTRKSVSNAADVSTQAPAAIQEPLRPQPASISVPRVSTTSNTPDASSLLSAGTASITLNDVDDGMQDSLYEDALEKLPGPARLAIAQYIHSGDLALGQAYAAALQNKQTCEDRRWKWSFKGREVVLAEIAGKIVKWLDRFKAVGDIAANADPINVGLPWAGFRLILETLVADTKQMACLLIGMDLTLAMSHRLQAYVEFYNSLSAHSTKSNLRQAIVNLYAKILSFTASAIATYKKNTALRILEAIWQESDLLNIETEYDKLGARVETEASICDRHLQSRNWTVLMNTLKVLDNIAETQERIEALHTKVDLTKLTTARGAIYDSNEEEHMAYCLEGTRIDILKTISSWSDNIEEKSIFWLCGMAGTGKSTIARTVCLALDENYSQMLGASFFFKRGEGNRGDGSRFFPTIARQLADRLPGMDTAIARALDQDSLLCERSLKKQFEQLISSPLQSCLNSTSPKQLIIVIDALDECMNSSHIPNILQLMANINVLTELKLRIFVTSRPETPIVHGFNNIDHSMHKEIKLEVVQVPTIRIDLETYIQHRLRQIKRNAIAEQSYSQLPPDWPSHDSIQQLVDLANPLFIFAFTTCRYISESNPARRLNIILEQSRNTTLTGIDKTYLPILNHMLSTFDELDRERIGNNFRSLIGGIVLLATPLSATALSDLLNIDMNDIDEILRHLRSVLSIPNNPAASIRMLHLSFRDFLVDQSKASLLGQLHVNEGSVHSYLAQQCLWRLDRPGTLKMDICNVIHPSTAKISLTSAKIESCLPPDVAYACRNWIYHTMNADDDDNRSELQLAFLKKHFFHWIEALSWLGRLSTAITVLQEFRNHLDTRGQGPLYVFMSEALRFVTKYHNLVSATPLQLYYSAVPFMPVGEIKKQVPSESPGIDMHMTTTVQDWGAEAYGLVKSATAVSTTAVSPDGALLALGDHDGVLSVLSAASGTPVWSLKVSSTPIDAVIFSSTGEYVVMAETSSTYNVTVRSAATGEEMAIIIGDSTPVREMLALPSDLLAIARAGSIQFWHAMNGQYQKAFQLPQRFRNVIALSADAQFVAADRSNMIHVWKLVEGGELQQIAVLSGHIEPITTIAFSASGGLLFSGSQDRSIRAWSPWSLTTNQQALELQKVGNLVHSRKPLTNKGDQTVQTRSELWRVGHIYPISKLVVSADGEMLASASIDGEIKLWSINEQRMLRMLDGHKSAVVALSFVRQTALISGSEDGTVKVWSLEEQKEVEQPRDGGDKSYRVVRVCFSEDNKFFTTESLSKGVTIWETEPCHILKRLDMAGGTCNDQSIMEDGSSLAWWTRKHVFDFYVKLRGEMSAPAVSLDNSVFVWSASKDIHIGDVATRSVIETIPAFATEESYIHALSLTHDGSMVAATDLANRLKVFRVSDGILLFNVTINKAEKIVSMKFSDDNQDIVTEIQVVHWGYRPQTRAWRIDTGVLLAPQPESQDSLDPRRIQSKLRTTRGTIAAIIESEQSGCLTRDGTRIRYLNHVVMSVPEDYSHAVVTTRGNTMILAKDSASIVIIKISEDLKERLKDTGDQDTSQVLIEGEQDAMDGAEYSFDEDDEELLMQTSVKINVTSAV